MMRLAVLTGLALTSAVAGCKPPPSDAAVTRVSLLGPASGPSEPLASPDTADAVWASTANPMRLVYGKPGQPVLLALECLDAASVEARLRITRHAAADAGAGALLALIGNGTIGRFPVDATAIGGRVLWQGEVSALNPAWEALDNARNTPATATVPGAGLVTLNPSPLPLALITACRGKLEPPAAPADRA